MKNYLFDAIRLKSEGKGFNNELRALTAKAEELDNIAYLEGAMIQLPMAELRGIVSGSAETKTQSYEITPTANVVTRARYIEGLAANALYPIMRNNCSRWESESGETPTYTHVMLTPHRMYSEILYSVDIILNSNSTLQNALTEDLVNDIYNKIERTMMSDSDGTDGNPKGLFDYIIPTELSELSFTNAEKDFYSSGAKQPLYIFSPSTYTAIRATYEDCFKDGKFRDIEYIVTSNMQDDCILLCDLNYLIVGLFGSLHADIDNVTRRKDGIIRMICNTFWDWNVTNKDAFQAIKITE